MTTFIACCALLASLCVTRSSAERACSPVKYLQGNVTDLSQKFMFSCGGSQEVLTVKTAATKAHISQCNQTSTKAKAYFSSACDGEEECILDIQKFEGCGLVVSMQCENSGIDTFTLLILLLIFVIIFAMGTTCTLDDFKEVWKHKKRAIIVGWLSQFGFMPLFAFSMARAFDFSDLVAVGVVLCGAAPGGTTSNLFTYWVGGNVSLSIAMSLASTACAVFMLPLLTEIYVMSTFTDGLEEGESIRIPFKDIVIIGVVTILIPATMGVAIRRYNTERKIWGKFIYKWVEVIGSAVGGLFLIAAVVIGINDNPDLMKPSVYHGEWILAALFQPVGCLFGLCVATAMKLDGRDRLAVALETGVQNYTLVIGICSLSYSGCTRVEALTFVLICSVWYVISSAWLVTALRMARKRGIWRLDVDSDVVDNDVAPRSKDTELQSV